MAANLTALQKKNGLRKVSLFKEMPVEYPQLWLEIFVVGDAIEQRAFADMFVRAQCTKAPSVDTADLVIFTGGADVNPLLYGETPHPSTFFNKDRDEADMLVYAECLKQGIPMFGVCRGAQFLHVMHGGKLYQDIDHHNGDHNIWDVTDNTMIKSVSSVHHQSCIPNPDNGMIIVADAYKSKNRWINDKVKETGPRTAYDVEAFFYRDTCSFGVQGHPEYKGYSEFRVWTLNKLHQYIIGNPDLERKGRNLRIKDDILSMREKKFEDKLKEFN